MDIPTADTYFITAIGIGIDQGDMQSVATWANYFLFYRDRGFPAESRRLLYGIKPYKSRLDAFGHAIVMHCEGLWEDLWGSSTRAEERLSRSISYILKSENLSLLSAVFNDLGVLYYRQGDWVRARQSYEESLKFLEFSSSRTRYEAMLYNNLGLTLYQTGLSEEGIHYLEKAVQLYEDSADEVNVARVWVNFGRFLEQQGTTDRALHVLEDALAILQKAEDTRILVELLNSLGILYRYRGMWIPAQAYYRESLEVARKIRDIGGQAQALSNLGIIAQRQGDLSEAHQNYSNALTLYTEAGDKHGIALVAGNIGHLLSLQGNHQSALTYYHESLNGYGVIGDIHGLLKARLNIAVAYRDLQMFEEANHWFVEVYESALKQPTSRYHDQVLAALGYYKILQKQWAEAELLLQDALKHQRQRKDVYAQVETVFKLGLVAYNRGEYDQVALVTEPGWILAQTYDYGQWLIELAFLCSEAAGSMASPAMLRYDTVAWYYATLYDSSIDAAKAHDRIFGFVRRVFHESDSHTIHELVGWLFQIWEEEPWAGTVTSLREQLLRYLQENGY